MQGQNRWNGGQARLFGCPPHLATFLTLVARVQRLGTGKALEGRTHVGQVRGRRRGRRRRARDGCHIQTDIFNRIHGGTRSFAGFTNHIGFHHSPKELKGIFGVFRRGFIVLFLFLFGSRLFRRRVLRILGRCASLLTTALHRINQKPEKLVRVFLLAQFEPRSHLADESIDEHGRSHWLVTVAGDAVHASQVMLDFTESTKFEVVMLRNSAVAGVGVVIVIVVRRRLFAGGASGFPGSGELDIRDSIGTGGRRRPPLESILQKNGAMNVMRFHVHRHAKFRGMRQGL
mmetsp:Transcript_64677/g.178847  ORF Transcript_64677/g.178847 Transcript_64677/m.178847 type:complete len:288 (-) Transcript_64677:528-1391(-)